MPISLSFNEKLMKQIDALTCLLETPAGQGTCNIIKISDENEQILLVTAKHCIFGKDFKTEVDLSNTHIHIPNKKSYKKITLSKYDQILIQEDIEFAIIIINKETYKNCLEKRIEPKLLIQSFTNLTCKFKGYPKVLEAMKPQSITAQFEDLNQLKTETPLSSIQYADPIYNCNGFSGSGVYITVDQELYLIGIIYALKEPFQFFGMQDLSFLNELLTSNGYNKITFGSLPENKSILSDIKNLNNISIDFSKRPKRTIGKDYRINREEIKSEIKNIIANKNTILITGLPGIGKTVEALNFLEELQSKDYQVLAFKAELFAKNSEQNFFPNVENRFQDIFDYILLNRRIVVLIDGFEKFLDVENDDYLIDFLTICKERKNVRLCLTCRKYALNQILFNYSSFFNSYETVNIPLLSDTEVNSVGNIYPNMTKLSNSENINKLLKRPFYLDIITRQIEMLNGNKNINEKEILFLIWDKIIEKQDNERGNIFEEIAYKRAKEMKLFVEIENVNNDLIEELFKDEIIIKDEILKKSYSPSHDIYEDIALIRIIEKEYNKFRDDIKKFFTSLGKEPAIRRGLRLWLNISLNNIDYNLNEFIKKIFNSKDIEYYWNNEILISILKSDYCEVFFNKNEEMILSNKASLLMRFISLLKTACIDVKYYSNINSSIKVNSNINKKISPLGNGWNVVVNFIYKHLTRLRQYEIQILGFLVLSWKRKISDEEQLPEESRVVAKILLSCIINYKSQYRTYCNVGPKDYLVESVIKLIFRLVEIIKSEFIDFINESIAYYETKSDDYSCRDFYTTLVKYLTGYYESKFVSFYFPEMVYKTSKIIWLINPTEINPLDDYLDRDEEDFGVSKNRGFSYFPASPYRTSLIHLLNGNTEIGLQLLVDIINHSTDIYINSDRCKNPTKFSAFFEEFYDRKDDNKIAKQFEIEIDSRKYIKKGNSVIWCMYRGTNEATPYLLQSLLMALEKWLLELAKENSNKSKKLITMAYNYLLKNSTSVATTSVLVSVALAYPETIGSLIFPVLRVKEFFSYDIVRMTLETSALAPMDMKNPEIKKERTESNNLEHRKICIEYLVTKLQISGYYREINEILDEHLDNIDKPDKTWQIMLSRMDVRRFKVDQLINEGEKQYVTFTVNYPDKLAEKIKENEKELEKVNIISAISNWCHIVIKNSGFEGNTCENWTKYFNDYLENQDILTGFNRILSDPALLAVIGFRDHVKDLTEDQYEWISNCIIQKVSSQIEKEMTNDYFSMSGTLYIDELLDILPLFLNSQSIQEKQNIVKGLIFLSLTELDKHHKESIINSVRRNLWNIDKDFFISCFKGLVEYSIIQKKHKNFKFYNESKDEYKERQTKYVKEKEKIINKVIDNSLATSLQKISFETHSIWHLITALKMIPHNTQELLLQNFYKTYLNLILSQFNEEKPDQHFDMYFPFYNNLAQFLLKQDAELSKSIIYSILMFVKINKRNHTYNLKEFKRDVLNQLFTIFDQERIDQYWILINYLSDNYDIFPDKSSIINLIFLNIPYINPDCVDWEPLRTKKDYYRNQIISLGYLDLESVAKFLSGLGSTSFLPEGIIWFMDSIRKCDDFLMEMRKGSTVFYCDKIIEKAFCKHFKTVKSNDSLKNNMLQLLDLMIMFESSTAYSIRERLITI